MESPSVYGGQNRITLTSYSIPFLHMSVYMYSYYVCTVWWEILGEQFICLPNQSLDAGECM